MAKQIMNDTMNHDITDVSLYRGSLNFFKATNIVFKSGESCPADAFGFLVSHSLELALKAYLLKKGMGEANLKSIGHSLVKAWSKSVGYGLPLVTPVPRWCELLDSAHSSPFLFRYARTNTGIVTPAQQESHSGLNKVLDIVGNEMGLDRNGNFV